MVDDLRHCWSGRWRRRRLCGRRGACPNTAATSTAFKTAAIDLLTSISFFSLRGGPPGTIRLASKPIIAIWLSSIPVAIPRFHGSQLFGCAAESIKTRITEQSTVCRAAIRQTTRLYCLGDLRGHHRRLGRNLRPLPQNSLSCGGRRTPSRHFRRAVAANRGSLQHPERASAGCSGLRIYRCGGASKVAGFAPCVAAGSGRHEASRRSRLPQFVRGTGFDYSRDLDRVAVAFWLAGEGMPPQTRGPELWRLPTAASM